MFSPYSLAGSFVLRKPLILGWIRFSERFIAKLASEFPRGPQNFIRLPFALYINGGF
ncbi:MAG: hypothetical protein CM1200mP14_25180 [Gammaproteobacteria bacterium]|nr:MAG: hypothetical protein CM1200mP14_25180 [Gammaproteobacteria bacterium]